MNTNSNSYTIIYASVLVIIVAFLLAFVNSSLRELQGKNVELDTKKQILSSLGIRDVQNPEAKFAEVVKEDMLVAEDGSLKPYEGAFADMRKHIKKKEKLISLSVKWTGKQSMLFLFTVPVFGVPSGDMWR